MVIGARELAQHERVEPVGPAARDRLKVTLVAIEQPDGLLVERLLDAGLRVLAMHPNQVAAARARFRRSSARHRPAS
jgi:hypothetical protein